MATRAEVANSEAIKQNTQDTLDLETKLTEMAIKIERKRGLASKGCHNTFVRPYRAAV